jgi:hypothetical protein
MLKLPTMWTMGVNSKTDPKWSLPILVAMSFCLWGPPVYANPCTDQNWVAAPVLSLSPKESAQAVAAATVARQSEDGIGGTGFAAGPNRDGIGGTGHSPDGIGGTGHSPDGIGGTGLAAGSNRDGIGGTGHSPDGIGGTGHSPDGIGGTGLAAAPNGDGIGGTGHSADGIGGTGFIGVISGFGSICVNGAEIHFDANTSVAVDGQSQSVQSLALGQFVAVTAQAHAGELHASQIAVLHSVVGPVQSFNAADGKIEILGQTLSLPAGFAALNSVRVGDMLAADGNRQPNGEILVTRIERVSAGTNVSVLGPVTQTHGTHFNVRGLSVQVSANSRGTVPAAGQEVLVQGSLASGVLQADFVIVNPQLRFSEPVSHLDLQGYVRATADSTVLNVDGANIAVNAQTALPDGSRLPAAGARVHVFANVRPDGGFVAARVRVERPPRPEGGQITPATTHSEVRQGRGDSGTSERGGKVERNDSAARPEGELARPDISRPSIERPQIERPEVVRPDGM